MKSGGHFGGTVLAKILEDEPQNDGHGNAAAERVNRSLAAPPTGNSSGTATAAASGFLGRHFHFAAGELSLQHLPFGPGVANRVQDEQHDDSSRKNAHMKRKEMSQRQIIDGRSATGQLVEHLPHKRNLGEVLDPHHGRTIGVLSPGKQVARKAGSKSEKEKEHPKPERNFTRLTVRTKKDDSDHVKDGDSHENLRTEMMNAAQQPAAPERVLNVEDALVSGLRTRTVVHPKDETRHALHHAEEKQDSRPHFLVHE